MEWRALLSWANSPPCPAKPVTQCVTAWKVRIPEPKFQVMLRSRRGLQNACLPSEATFALKKPCRDWICSPKLAPSPVYSGLLFKTQPACLSLGRKSVNRQTLLPDHWPVTSSAFAFNVNTVRSWAWVQLGTRLPFALLSDYLLRKHLIVRIQE